MSDTTLTLTVLACVRLDHGCWLCWGIRDRLPVWLLSPAPRSYVIPGGEVPLAGTSFGDWSGIIWGIIGTRKRRALCVKNRCVLSIMSVVDWWSHPWNLILRPCPSFSLRQWSISSHAWAPGPAIESSHDSNRTWSMVHVVCSCCSSIQVCSFQK